MTGGQIDCSWWTQAVYAYPSGITLEAGIAEVGALGMFGENFARAPEDELNWRSVRVGSAVVMVSEPRMPCYKLGIDSTVPTRSEVS